DNPLYSEDPDELVKNSTDILKAYFDEISETFPEEHLDGFLFKNSGLTVMLYYFENLLATYPKQIKKKEFEDYLAPLVEYFEQSDLEELRGKCTSESGRNKLSNEITLYVANSIGDEDLKQGIPKGEFQQDLTEMEDLIRKLVNQEMTAEYGEDWLEEKMDRDRLEGYKADASPPDQREDVYEFLTLGDCMHVIQENFDVFENIFIRSGGFDNKEEFIGALQRLAGYRNTIRHKGRQALQLTK
ncbi:MAG: hypothetical protein ABEI86_12265, partial [Halobacteriaceae archaeon]